MSELREAAQTVGAWAVECDGDLVGAYLTETAAKLVAENMHEANRGRDFVWRVVPLVRRTHPPCDVTPPTESPIAAKCQRIEGSGEICGLTPPCPDCGKALPIRFSGPMVKAILDGSKTQTRRVVKQDRDGLLDCKPTPAWDAFWQCVACPYGKPGDRLWVRETFGIDDEDGAVLYFADPDTAQNAEHARICEDRYPRRRPSIHMPRWASRILLEVTDVRVERLQDISEADARAEGVKVDGNGHAVRDEVVNVGGARTAFAELWESINGPDSWSANPWVWVVEFRRIEP